MATPEELDANAANVRMMQQQSEGLGQGLETSSDEEQQTAKKGQPQPSESSQRQPQSSESSQPNIMEQMRLLTQNLMTSQTEMTRKLLEELRGRAPTANGPTVETQQRFQSEGNG